MSTGDDAGHEHGRDAAAACRRIFRSPPLSPRLITREAIYLFASFRRERSCVYYYSHGTEQRFLIC